MKRLPQKPVHGKMRTDKPVYHGEIDWRIQAVCFRCVWVGHAYLAPYDSKSLASSTKRVRLHGFAIQDGVEHAKTHAEEAPGLRGHSIRSAEANDKRWWDGIPLTGTDEEEEL